MKVFLTRLVLLTWSICATGVTAQRFFLDYSIVEHSLKNDKGYSKELLDFASRHRQQADFLAEFWWTKAKKECKDTFDEIAHRYASQVNSAASAADRAKLEAAAKAESDQCVYGVLYDHWDEINKMILNKIKTVTE